MMRPKPHTIVAFEHDGERIVGVVQSRTRAAWTVLDLFTTTAREFDRRGIRNPRIVYVVATNLKPHEAQGFATGFKRAAGDAWETIPVVQDGAIRVYRNSAVLAVRKPRETQACGTSSPGSANSVEQIPPSFDEPALMIA